MSIFPESTRLRVVQPLLARHALSPDDAEPVKIANAEEREALDYLIAHGIVGEGAPGRYYVHVAALGADIAATRRRRAWIWLGIAVAIALAAILFYR